MEAWISYLVVFGIGVEAGVLFMMIKPRLASSKSKRTEQVAARSRILAGIKEQHDQEILHEAFRATEAIKGELDQSLRTLKLTLSTLGAANPAPLAQPRPVVQLSNPVESESSAS